MRALLELTPWRLKRRIGEVEERLGRRLDGAENRLDLLESALRAVQQELADLREGRCVRLEHRADAVEQRLHGVSDEVSRLRDRVLPAAVGRADALLERLAEELEETASLVERQLQGEPLPAGRVPPTAERELADALATVQPRLLEQFRGTENEIVHRLDRYLEDLRGAEPVLDLGCGRGEMLLMLRDAGISATGIEGDPALAAAARRRGLQVTEGDVLEVLRAEPDDSRGAVTAMHLFEHLSPEVLAAVLAEVRRILKPDGRLIAECPNPHTLRVGAALFWQDPTHFRPLLPETLELFLTGAGFHVVRRETFHPFPDGQMLSSGGEPSAAAEARVAALERRLDDLCSRLDELLNGPRDFAVWALKPGPSS